MQTCFILNPVAGKGRSLKAMEKAAAVFDSRNAKYEIRRTEGPGDAIRLAEKTAKDGFDLVVSVGGDGTVCEVAQGILGKDVAMGIIPGGTGNDYRRCLGIPKDPAAAARVLLDGRARAVDCMQVDEFIGLNISTVGFDSEVTRNAPKFARFKGASYFLSVLYSVPRYKSPDLSVTLDDGTVFFGPRFLVAAGNGTHYGGGIKVLPDSDPADGLLDLCIIDSVDLPKDYFTLFPKIIKGTYKLANRSEIHCLRVRSLTIESETPLALNIDGTLFENRYRVSIAVLPSALSVIAPEK